MYTAVFPYVTAAAALFDPTTGTLDPHGHDDPHPHAALRDRLTNGQVLVTGTYNESLFRYMPMGEIYTPDGVQLTAVTSNKTHGGAGEFAIPLPLSGSAGIECRSGGASNAHKIVFTFANTLTSVSSATLSSGAGTVSSSGIGADAHQYIVDLTGVTNAQIITVNLTNVTDSAGNNSATVPVSMGVLLGDTSGNKTVNSSDVSQTKLQSGQAVTCD